MANYRIKSTGEPVKKGDLVTTTKERRTSFGVIKTTDTVMVTDAVIPQLIKQGVIEEVHTVNTAEAAKSVTKVNNNITYYVDKLAEQFNTTTDKMADILDKMNTVCPTATMMLLLRTIAKEYCIVEGKSISDHKGYYWYISTVNGSVNRLEKAPENWEQITLFKEQAYAQNAKNILKDQFKFMYGK